MTALTIEQTQYIEQEVKIRLHDEKFQLIERDFNEIKLSIHRLDDKLEASINYLDNKFDSKIDASVKHLDGKIDNQFKWLIGIFFSSAVIAIALHFIKIG